MLGDVEETIYVVEEDEDEEETIRVGLNSSRTKEELAKILQTIHKKSEMLFVRGIFFAPILFL